MSCGEWEQAALQNKGKSDQPEEATVKEQRVDDIVMDQGTTRCGVTKMWMDEMLINQVMAPCQRATSRVCVNEEKYEPATIRGMPADLVKKGQAREIKDLDDIEWVEESMVPKDAQSLDCGWAMKMKSPSEVHSCGIASGNTCCLTHDRRTKYLSRQYLKVHAHGRRDLKNILTALRHPWKWSVVDRDSSQGVRDLDQQQELAKIREHWERTITRETELELENCSS